MYVGKRPYEGSQMPGLAGKPNLSHCRVPSAIDLNGGGNSSAGMPGKSTREEIWCWFSLMWHAHLARVFTGGTPVPLFRNLSREEKNLRAGLLNPISWFR